MNWAPPDYPNPNLRSSPHFVWIFQKLLAADVADFYVDGDLLNSWLLGGGRTREDSADGGAEMDVRFRLLHTVG